MNQTIVEALNSYANPAKSPIISVFSRRVEESTVRGIAFWVSMYPTQEESSSATTKQ